MGDLPPSTSEGGETAARAGLERWLAEGDSRYPGLRDDLAADATSKMSIPLHLGLISPLLPRAAPEGRGALGGGRGRSARLLRLPLRPWRKLRSTNPPERFNREVGRRTDVVGIFPNDRGLIRLAASVVIEQNDEWLVGRRYLSNHSLEAILAQDDQDNDRKESRELTAA